MSTFDRRALLGTAAAAALGTRALGAASSGSRAPLYEVSLAQWSLHRALRGGELDNLDFARTAAELGIGAVEYVNTFFEERALDDGYLDELERRAADAGVRSLLIMVDGEGELGDPDAARRARAVRDHVRWLYAARRLGCHSIRVNAASRGTWEEQRELAADGLRRLCEVADGLELSVLVENHGGLSSNGRWLAETIRTVDHPRAGTLPDFGNFRVSADEQYDRYAGVAELMPFARAVSAKSHEFDAAGDEVRTDYRRMLRIVVDAGYAGFVGVEYEGDVHGELEGIRLTKELLERVRDELAG